MRLGTYYRSWLLDTLDIGVSQNLVLDVGSLDGYWLSQQTSKVKVCLDIDPVAQYADVNYIKADALALPFDDDVFHHVLSIDVIEHVPDERIFVSELYRVTRPGGRITLSMPNKNLRMFPPFITNWASRKWGHYKCNGYTEDEIRSFVPNGASIKTLHVREFWMRLLYFPLRMFWAFNSKSAKWFLDTALRLERRMFKGEHGRLVVTIEKQGFS